MSKDNPNYQTVDNMSQENHEPLDKTVNRKHFQPNSNYFTIVVYALIFVLGAILIVNIIGSFSRTLQILKTGLGLISPFIIGSFIAFILYPPVRFFYRKLFIGALKFKSKKLAKWLSIALTYLLAIGIIAILMVFIIPQIYKSILDIIEILPEWYQGASDYVTSFGQKHTDWTFIDFNMINKQLETIYPKILDYLTSLLTNLLPYVVTTSMAIVKGIFNLIIAIMVSVYMISDHKNIFYHFKRLLYALFPKKGANKAITIGKNSCDIFLGFIYGKALDSLIIGIICFICMMIFRFPYAILISVIVGITNMIPYFGPYMGGILGGIIIIIINPIQVIFFAIMILVIQQFDGLFLGPKILGDSTGLKPLWVIFSIVVGGSLFGVVGMFLGVPCVAVLSYILNLIVEYILNKKQIAVKPYDSPDEM